jgi:hypothetical protein
MRTEVVEAAKGDEVVDMEELIDYAVNPTPHTLRVWG